MWRPEPQEHRTTHDHLNLRIAGGGQPAGVG